jgi:hypothetical protein
MTTSGTPDDARSGRRRSTVVLSGLGLLVAVWLGLTAPSVSPVAGQPPGVTQLTNLEGPAPGAGP